MRTWTRLTILVILMLAGGALAGCHDSPVLPLVRRSEIKPAQGQTVPALVLMVPQTGTVNDGRLSELIDSLNDLNPSLQITLTISGGYEADLAEALASNRPPDVFLTTGSQLSQLVNQEVIRATPDGWIERNRLLRAAADAIELDAQSYCFPHSIHTTALVYNVDLFQQADVDMPTTQWAWQDLAAAATALTDDEAERVGIVLDPSPTTWIPFYLQAGGEVIVDEDGDAVFSLESARAASEMLAGLFAEGAAVAPGDRGAAWAGEAFARGGIGMTIAGDWILTFLEENPPDFTYATVELPQGPARRANVAYVNCLAVHAGSVHPDLALQLAAQLTAPEVLNQWTEGEGPSVYLEAELAANAGYSQINPYLQAMRYATPWRYGEFTSRYEDLFADGLALVAAEELTSEEFWPHLLRGGVASALP